MCMVIGRAAVEKRRMRNYRLYAYSRSQAAGIAGMGWNWSGVRARAKVGFELRRREGKL
jgi:hypothetical protein